MSKSQDAGGGTMETPKDGGGNGGGAEQDLATLTNALRFEREKNQVLLGEVVALEDDLVNRQLADYAAIISESTREFWREQLLSNREAALGALAELAKLKDDGDGGGRNGRPLHNRETVRPLQRRGFAGEGGTAEPESDSTAVRIRNRAHELSKLERIPFSTAFRRAEKEIVGEKS